MAEQDKKPAVAGKPAEAGKPAASKTEAAKPEAAKPEAEKPAAAKTEADKSAKPKAPAAQSAKSSKSSKTAPADKSGKMKDGYVPRLQALYYKELRAKLAKELGCKNLMQVPRLQKIVLNMGVGEAAADSKKIQGALDALQTVAGQKPVTTRAKKSVAGFKVRAGMALGAKVTLRRGRMYEFLDRLVTTALPRVRDFRGLNPNSFDGAGNYALGLHEHIVFPEVDYDSVEEIRGLDIVICTNARDDAAARALLREFRLPFTS